MHSKRYHPGDRLRPLALFVGCRRHELAHADRLFTHLRLPDGRALMRAGNAGDELFLIQHGVVRVRRHGREIARLGPGDVVGELALLDRRPRTADAWADGPLDVLVQSTAEFASLLARVPLIAERLELVADARRPRAAT